MAVLALHGFTGAGDDFRPVADPDWLTPDVIGHGAVAPRALAPYAIDAEAARIGAMAPPDALLIGYSMGGRLALTLAARAPGVIRGLVLIGATPGIEDAAARAARRADDGARADRIEAIGVPAFLDAWQRVPIIASQRRIPADVRAAMRARRLRHRPWGLANSLRGMGAGAMPSLWHRLSAIPCPALLVTGAEDEKFDGIADAMARAMPRAERAVIGGAGHCAHLERPDAFRRALADWRGRTGL